PVSAPGYVAGDRPRAIDVDGHTSRVTIARDVLHRHPARPLVLEADHTHGRIEPVRAGLNSAEGGQRHGNADRPVAAHAEHADVVEEDDAGDAPGFVGLDEKGTHKDV